MSLLLMWSCEFSEKNVINLAMKRMSKHWCLLMHNMPKFRTVKLMTHVSLLWLKNVDWLVKQILFHNVKEIPRTSHDWLFLEIQIVLVAQRYHHLRAHGSFFPCSSQININLFLKTFLLYLKVDKVSL